MACIEHVEEVRQIEARLAAMRASKHQSGTSENILVGLEQLRQIVGEEVRKALHEDESDWQAQIVTLPTPANAISVEWNIGGKRYKGILFEQKEEETTA